jgi:hypothetical protein
MSNVIDFPKREYDIEVDLEEVERNFHRFEERISSLAEILDLNVQGMYHTLDVETDEIMMALLHLSAIWSVRAEIEPADYMALVQGIHLEITDNE